MLRNCGDWASQIILTFYRFQLKLEYNSIAGILHPRIYQVKYAIIGPDSLLNLLVNSDTFRFAQSGFIFLCGQMKEPVL